MSNSTVSQQNFETSNNHQQNDFQTGEFIVSRPDIFLDWPPIWRVDSKTLLQKFEPFHSNNKTIYRSLSTVSVCKMDEQFWWKITIFTFILCIFYFILVCTMGSGKSSFICVSKMSICWTNSTRNACGNATQWIVLVNGWNVHWKNDARRTRLSRPIRSVYTDADITRIGFQFSHRNYARAR